MFLFMVGAGLCTNHWMLGIGWLIFLFALAQAGILRLHLHMYFAFLVPLALGILLVQGLAIPIEEGKGWWEPFGLVAPTTVLVVFRVAVIAAAAQLCLLPILNDGRLIAFLRAWRCAENVILVTIAGVTLLAEVRFRAQQILESRLSSGYGARTRMGAIRQLPFLLMPLLVYMLDAASKRSEYWVRRNLRQRLASYMPTTSDHITCVANCSWLGASSAWCVMAAFSRWN